MFDMAKKAETVGIRIERALLDEVDRYLAEYRKSFRDADRSKVIRDLVWKGLEAWGRRPPTSDEERALLLLEKEQAIADERAAREANHRDPKNREVRGTNRLERRHRRNR